MGQYVAPIRDMQFVLHEFLNVTEEFKNLPAYQEIDADIINQVLEEGAKFTQEVLFPLNHSGDREGCHFDAAAKTVTTPKGFKEAYKQYVEGGWAALACDPEYGGQGLPVALNNSFYEMLNSSNQAWSMYPGLSHGAYECLKEHGTDDHRSSTCRSWSRANGPAPCA
jgi:alkylation response protein AidB-like acyl-CoA dehydrogenase